MEKYFFIVLLSYRYNDNLLESGILRYWFSNYIGIVDALYEK